uniref:Integrase catalytic domain-containing protein n=1 Tax=Trichuris muris TaxID=70415 RepID=A0A5S6QDD1_TRIMR
MNFVGGQPEITEGIKRLKSTKIREYMAQKGLEWQFNPPGASHFGGAWERLIRSAKRALMAINSGQRLTDESLQTVVTEVEGLTHVSRQPEDPEPLTPNHILLGRPYAMIPPGVFHPREVTSRCQWRSAQTIVDRFRRRWMRE